MPWVGAQEELARAHDVEMGRPGGRGFRQGVQPMGWAWGIESELVVRQIGHCFGSRGKEGRRLHPTHRQNEGGPTSGSAPGAVGNMMPNFGTSVALIDIQ
jgi:hypothetical protein